MGLMSAGNGGRFSIPKNTESKNSSHFGDATTISCDFPESLKGNCAIVGSLYEYAPAHTGFNGIKVSGCRKYKVVQCGSPISTSPGQTVFFAVFVEGATIGSTLYTDSLTTNSGSTITLNVEFFW